MKESTVFESEIFAGIPNMYLKAKTFCEYIPAGLPFLTKGIVKGFVRVDE